MEEYTQLKLEYYRKPIKLITSYKKVIAIILLIFSLISIIYSLIFSFSSIGVSFALNIAYASLLFLSIFSFSLLDKTTFFINLSCIGFKIIWIIVSVIMSLVAAFSMSNSDVMSNMTMAADKSMAQGNVDATMNAMHGTIVITTIISCVIQLAIAAYLIIVGIQFIKNKSLFFSSFQSMRKAEDDE